MELNFNNQETAACNNNSVYAQYKKWLTQNGVLVDPRIRYPTYFGQKNKGVVGVSASKPIEKGKVIIAVPYNLLITMDKVMNVEILHQIIRENPDVFGDPQNCVMKMLVLYVCYELLKGKQSFYYTYFQISKDSYLQKWRQNEMLALQNKQLIKSLKTNKQKVQLFFLEFLRLFTKYQKVFPPNEGNIFYQKLFQRAYNFVATRAFGWSLPSISLIPMADSLNHGNNYLNHYLIDISEERKPSQNYISRKQKSNLSLLKQQDLMPSQKVLTQLRKKKKRRYQKFIQKHQQILKSSKQLSQLSPSLPSKFQHSPITSSSSSNRNNQYFILCQQYKSQVRNLRQLHFYQTSCSQDNDTDQQQLTEFVMKREKFQFDQKYHVNNLVYTDKNNKEKKNNGNEGKKIMRKAQFQQYWKLWTDNNLEEEEQEDSEQEEIEQEKMTLPSQKGLNKNQKKQILQKYDEKHKESEGSSQESSTESEQDDQQFDWMDAHEKQEHKNTYFVMQTRQIIRQNEQMHNFYGRRSNKFLLQNYNFVMGKNQYDSFSFRMIADASLSVKPNIQKLIYFGKKKPSKKPLTRQIRLKKSRINIQLINHCRCYTLQCQKKQIPSFIPITIPFSSQLQQKSLKLYKQLIQSLQNQYVTTEQQDYELLSKSAQQHQIRTALKYRIIQKEILNNQIEMVQKCMEYLGKRWKNGRIEKPTWKDIRDIKSIKEYLKQLQRGNVK